MTRRPAILVSVPRIAPPGAAQPLPVTGQASRRERCAPGRRLPLLGPPGHGGVGARPVLVARCTG